MSWPIKTYSFKVINCTQILCGIVNTGIRSNNIYGHAGTYQCLLLLHCYLFWEFIPCDILRSFFTAAINICSRYPQVCVEPFFWHITLLFVYFSPYSFAPPSDNNFSVVRKSTAEMLKSQTDWLKTFQQEMSTFNRPTPKSTPSAITPSNSRNLTTLYPFKNSYCLVSYCRK